jgi:co-chaperonin GroES (HSP10)
MASFDRAASGDARTMARKSELVRVLLDRYGTTYAEEAGIRLADKPSPLYRLLVLALLLSARIGAPIAVAAAKELSTAGMRTPRAMAEASWQQRVDALGRGGYRRYDERTSTMLGEGAELLLEKYRGDLRKLRQGAEGRSQIEELLQEFKGIGPLGAAIFCREVQGLWTELAPYVDDRAAEGAAHLGLPRTPSRLAAYVDRSDLPRLLAACVRAGHDEKATAEFRRATRADATA